VRRRGKAVRRLDKTPELPARLLGLTFSLSRQGLANICRAALSAANDDAGAAPPEFSGTGPIPLIEIKPG
jgi:hypothetical protein